MSHTCTTYGWKICDESLIMSNEVYSGWIYYYFIKCMFILVEVVSYIGETVLDLLFASGLKSDLAPLFDLPIFLNIQHLRPLRLKGTWYVG